jgi:outer membrane protein TolC
MENLIKRWSLFIFLWLFSLCSSYDAATQPNADSILQQATLDNLVRYALKRQPQVQQALMDEEITGLQVKSRLSAWYPQVNFGYIYQHNFRVQTSIIGGNVVRLGVNNTSAVQFSATQNIFDRDVLFAMRTRGNVMLQSRQQTETLKINLVADVSKAFYDVLATEQQIRVGRENIVRIERSLQDARSRYDAGIVDKTDYKRATIALNNARAFMKSNQEALSAKTIYLKTLVNYPDAAPLAIVYDSVSLENEISFDTLRIVDYDRRIEYQLLETQRKLLEANVRYQKWNYIPTVSANGAYNFNFFNNSFGKLYSQSYPNAFAALTVAFPIFQGGRRKYEIRIAESQLKRADLALVAVKNTINAEYYAALANYKASLANYLALKENVALAREVYDVIQLQYNSGIKTYLEVITAEADLRTAEINYFNALFQIISNKIDVQRSLGEIRY